MVVVHGERITVCILALALATVSFASATVGAEIEEEPACRPADDGTGAVICDLPDECQTDPDQVICQVPSECERLDETTFRCEPSDGAGVDANGTAGSVASELHCEPAPDDPSAVICSIETCEASNASSCLPPDCERVNETTARCALPGGHSAGNGTADYELLRGESSNESGSPPVECRPGDSGRTLVCQASKECRNSTHERCRPPDYCEPVGDNRYRCDPPRGQQPPPHPDRRPRNDTDRFGAPGDGPDCQAGPEPGTVVCQPPAECEGRIGETPACTPPPECQQRADGTFLCEIPDRAHTGATSGQAPNGNASSSMPDGDVGESSLFAGDAQARSEARADIAEALNDAAASFREDLKDLKRDYRSQVEGLRAEYQQGKQDLRADYEACRDSIPDDVSPSDRSDRLRACLDEAREGIRQLKANLTARHQEIQKAAKEKAEQARSQACEEAEQAAIDAIARHGLFDANPADLLPEQALELCPTFADFGSTMEGQR